MKIAVVSDIHGNMEAVVSVMEDIEAKECEKIFVLGDYAMAGPEPAYTVEYFMKRKDDPKFVMIQGNTDFMIANFSDELYDSLKEKAPVMAEALKNDVELLNPVQKEFLKNLPIQKEVILGDEKEIKFLLVHGSPRKNNEDILPDTPLQTVEEMLTNVEASVVLCGHTHIPCGFQTSTKQTVVNAGSIGRTFFMNNLVDSKNNPKACYLTIEIEDGNCIFQHQFVNYDKQRASEKLAKRSFKGADKLAQTLLNPEVRHF